MKNWKLLFNPFKRYSEGKLITIGFLAFLIGSALAFIFRVRFDNFMHMTSAPEVKWYQPFLDNLIIFSVLFILLFAIGKYLNTKTRPIDILSTVLIGNIPFYLMTFTNINNATAKASEEMIEFASHSEGTIPSGSLIFLMITGILGLGIIIWEIALLYNGFKVSTNAKGGVALFLFIVALLATTVITVFIPLPY